MKALRCPLFAPVLLASFACAEPTFPPKFPNGEDVVTVDSPDLLTPPPGFPSDVDVAKTPPTVDALFYPDQDYPGKPWSVWGDSLAVNGKYYASIGDHLAPAGNAFVYEYDPLTKKLRKLVDVRRTLGLPEGHYSPGKIHGRLDLGRDGWLYFSTHRGSTRVTTDAYHYKGDWIMRSHPKSGTTEIVAHGPVSKHCIPCSVMDPNRMIFYGGTAPGTGQDGEGVQFFAYDVRAGKVRYAGPYGPARAMIFAKSTGRVYFTPGKGDDGPLMRYDPEDDRGPQRLSGKIGIRAATEETPDGFVYTVSNGQGDTRSMLYRLNTKTETIESLGPAAVGSQNYITSIDADSTGNFLYYIPGAHGGSENDGSPIVQYDIRSKKKKVIAFLHPLFFRKLGCTLQGTFSSAIDPSDDKLYITWNNSRGGKVWDSCVLTVIHIPEQER